jgi:cell division transport system permease protein
VRVKGWLDAHAGAFRQALRRFGEHPLASLFEVAVFGIALALPLGFQAALENARAFAARFPAGPELSVFMTLEATKTDVGTIEARLGKLPDLERVSFVPRAEALAQLRKAAGLADVLDALPANPLPDAFFVRLKQADSARLQAAQAEIGKWPQVALVQVDSGWARKLEAVIGVSRAAVALIGLLLSGALLAITVNTVRLQMLDRREEIELCTLIGATRAFIRRPFLYFGALQGLFGGAVALGIVYGAAMLLNRSLAALADAYGTPVRFDPLAGAEAAVVVFFAAGLGYLAAWLSTSLLGKAGKPA